MLLRILLPLLFLLWLTAWGIFRLERPYFARLKSLVRRLFFLPHALLSAALLLLSVNESYDDTAASLKALLLSVFLCVIVPQALTALLLCPVPPLRRHWPRAGRAVRGGAYIAGGIVLGAMIYGFTAGYRHIVVKEYTYRNAALPAAFDGYRIVQLSDLHLGTLRTHPEVVKDIVDSVNACKADLIVFTGDLVNYDAREALVFTDILSRMHARDGVMSVMGNHDYAQYFRWASAADSLGNIRLLHKAHKAMGWRLLLNENAVVRRGSDSIAIVGVENDGNPPFPALGDLDKAQRGLATGCFKVLLSHDPTHWRRRVIPETDIALTLSGHTHGMQFKIGGFSPASWFYPEWGGAYADTKGHTLYVSLGTGEVLLPFRLGAWPEINVITLKCK